MKQNVLSVLLGYAGSHRRLTFLGLSAFRTAANIRKQGMAHVMQAPLGYFDANASGLIRSRLDGAAADTETLLAYNLADIVGTITLFLAMLVLMFVFDWRMGAACLLVAVISILSRIMFAASGMMLASTALGRIQPVMETPTLAVPEHPQTLKDNRVVFRDVSFTYDGAQSPALSQVSFTAEPGQTMALVGPSGGGKTTAASLIPRFCDADTGTVEVGGLFRHMVELQNESAQ